MTMEDSRLNIRLEGPPNARRRIIFKGDEATISLLGSKRPLREADGSGDTLPSFARAGFSRFDGLVERLQRIRPISREKTISELPVAFRQEFGFCISSWSLRKYTPDDPMYHILKYAALRLAGRMFPGNFLPAHELHIFHAGRSTYSAMYSDHVPGSEGALERRKDQYRRYYEASSDDERGRVQKMNDDTERRMCPGLIPKAMEVRSAGLLVRHPEANYAMHEGKVLFFEIAGLDIDLALSWAKEKPQADRLLILEDIAYIHAATIRNRVGKLFLKSLLAPGSGDEDLMDPKDRICNWVLSMPILQLRDLVLLSYLKGEHRGLEQDFPYELGNKLNLGDPRPEPFDPWVLDDQR